MILVLRAEASSLGSPLIDTEMPLHIPTVCLDLKTTRSPMESHAPPTTLVLLLLLLPPLGLHSPSDP